MCFKIEALVTLATKRINAIAEAITSSFEAVSNIKAGSLNFETGEPVRQSDIAESHYFLLCLLSACLEQWRCSQEEFLVDDDLKQRSATAHDKLPDNITNAILNNIMPNLRHYPRMATAINRASQHRVSRLICNKDASPRWRFIDTYNCPFVSEHCTTDPILVVKTYIMYNNIIFLVSAANWKVTFNKILSGLELMTRRTSGSPDEWHQLGDVRILEYCALNQSRLSNVLSGKSELRAKLFNLENPILADFYILSREGQGANLYIDVHFLLVDCFITLFLLNPRYTIYDLFPVCVHEEAPLIYKSSLARSLRFIIDYYAEFPNDTINDAWQPGSPFFYNLICTPLRRLFLACTSVETRAPTLERAESAGSSILSTESDSRMRGLLAKRSERLFTVSELLLLYSADPLLMVMGNERDRAEQNLDIVVAVTQCLQENNIEIVRAASFCIHRIHKAKYIPYWGPEDAYMEYFWNMTSHIVLTLAKILLDKQLEQAREINQILTVLQEIYHERNTFLMSMDQESALKGWNSSDYLQATIGLEVALMVLLCSPNQDVLNKTFQCFGLLCVEIEHLFYNEDGRTYEGSKNAASLLLENYPVYKEISKLHNANIVAGRKLYQKRIWRLLRMMPHDAPGHVVAWKEVWKRWKRLNAFIVRSASPSSPGGLPSPGSGSNSTSSRSRSPSASSTKLAPVSNTNLFQDRECGGKPLSPGWSQQVGRYTEWHNYSGFLASLAGVCSAQSDSAHVDELAGQASQFLSEMVRLLASQDAFIRERSKDVLSTELSPAMRSALLRHLEHTISHCAVASRGDDCMLAVEHTIIILTTFLENVQDEPTSVSALSSMHFSDLIDQCATYLFCKAGSQSNTHSGINIPRMRLRFARLCEVIMITRKKHPFITLHGEFKLRTKLLEIIIEWTSSFGALMKGETLVFSPGGTGKMMDNSTRATSPVTSPRGDENHIYRELEHQCIRAMTLLLDKLPLQPTDFHLMRDLSHEDGNSTEQLRYRLFSRYFKYFMHLLLHCIISLNSWKISTGSDIENAFNCDNDEFGGPCYAILFASINVEKCVERPIHPPEFADLIRGLTITGLANLIGANVSVGLKQALPMMYCRIHGVRTAFLEIFATALKRGASFEGLSDTIEVERYNELLDIITDDQDDFAIAMLMSTSCPAPKIDIIANGLLACLGTRGKITAFMKILITKEVQNTNVEAQLFRHTSVATHFLSGVAKRCGTEYIQEILYPVFRALNNEELPPNTSFELNPSRLKPDEDIEANRENVAKLTDKLLTAICESADAAPSMIREICYNISECTAERFPEARYTAVGAFIFLRFFCPAIVAPESIGIKVKMNPNLHRGLLLAGKIAQNLANNVLFGVKEAFMIPLNDFVTCNTYRVICFMRDVSMKPNCHQVEYEVPMENEDYALMHHMMLDSIDPMAQALWNSWYMQGITTAHSSNETLAADYRIRQKFDRMTDLLAHLGIPPDIRSHHQDYYLHGRPLKYASIQYSDFMRRHNGCDVREIMQRSAFYASGRSKAGRPIVYFILRRLRLRERDCEPTLYYLLKILERVSVEPFEILIDYTLFSEDNWSPDRSWFTQLILMTPYEIYKNISAIYGYNPNSALSSYLKQELIAPVKRFLQHIIFVTSISSLHAYIYPSELCLPKLGTILEEPPLIHLRSVYRINSTGKRIPVNIKLGQHYVQVATTKKQKLFEGVNSVIVDVYPISKIDDIFLGLTADAETDFRFRIKDKSIPIMCSTASANDASRFVFVLKNMKSRCQPSGEEQKSATDMNLNRPIHPEDVPGIFLNIALLNMGMKDPELRIAAYHFLCSLGYAFRFEITNQLIDAKEICIPENDSTMIKILSTKLAMTEPQLTLDVFREWFVGFKKSPSIRYLCFTYILPWFDSLAMLCQKTDDYNTMFKVKEILGMFAELTYASDNNIRRLLQNKVWKTISELVVEGNHLIDLALDTIISYAEVHGGIGVPHTDVMADVIVAMFNTTICSKLITRLNKLITKTAFNWTSSLINHPHWRDIMIIVRFLLMGTFNYRGPVRNFVPEITHVLSLIVGVGSTLERETVHSLMVNMKHALCVSEPLFAETIERMHHRLELTAARRTRLLYGLTKERDAFSVNMETTTDSTDCVPLIAVERVVNNLMIGTRTVAPNPDIANAWRSRWLSLATSVAFQLNPAIQPRAFIEIGCLAQECVDDDLLYQILVALDTALCANQPSVVLGIVMCLRNMVSSLPKHSRYLVSLFWIAIALIQLGDEALFPYALELAISVVRTLNDRHLFQNATTTANLLLDARRGWADDLDRRFDQLSGVNFEKYFSFAIVALLLHHGMNDVELRSESYSAIEELLALELKLANNSSAMANEQEDKKKQSEKPKHDASYHVLGYVAGVSVRNPVAVNMDDVIRQEQGVQVLFLTLLAYQMNALEEADTAKISLYSTFSEAARLIPKSFSIMYDSLVPKMNKAVYTSSDPELLKSIESIIVVACSNRQIDERKRNQRTLKHTLDEMGFWGISNKRRKREVINYNALACDVIKAI
ncbi:hypothetical protein K492DRAFT_234094, partial [Lichtheimia hyalospora FSU 10163]